MRKLIILLMIMVNASAYSQNYKPFPNDSATWGMNVYHYSPGFSVTNYTTQVVKSDTNIYGVSFKKVYQNSVSENNLIGFYREIDKRVYIKRLQDTGQVLLYDFNLQNNDTFYLKVKYLGDPVIFKYQVQSIGSSTLTNDSRKQFNLKMVAVSPSTVFVGQGCDDIYWIEGIGSDKGIFMTLNLPAPCYAPAYNPKYTLKCFENKLIEYLLSCSTTGFEQNSENRDFEIIVFPNPVTEYFTVEGFENANLLLFDAKGNLIFNTKIKGHIITSQLPPGLYFGKVTVKNNTKNFRMIKQ